MEQALGLLAEAVELTSDAELRADAQHLRGRLLVSRGEEGGGELLWREGLRVVERDRARGTIMVAESIGAYLWAFDLGQAVEVAQEVERSDAPGTRSPTFTRILLSVSRRPTPAMWRWGGGSC